MHDAINGRPPFISVNLKHVPATRISNVLKPDSLSEIYRIISQKQIRNDADNDPSPGGDNIKPISIPPTDSPDMRKKPCCQA